MLSVGQLRDIVNIKRQNKDLQELQIKTYNEAMSYNVCPSCGSEHTLKITYGVNQQTIKCSSCRMTAQWHPSRAAYTNFKEWKETNI